MRDRHRTRLATLVCTAACLLGGCGVSIGDVGEGVLDVAVWTVEGTGTVVKTVAVTALDVSGAVARKAATEAGETADAADRAGLSKTALQAVAAQPAAGATLR